MIDYGNSNLFIFSVINSNLLINYRENEIINYNYNSNDKKITARLFGNNIADGYFFTSNQYIISDNTSNLIYSGSNHYFNGDLNVNGKISGTFQDNVVILNNNNKIDPSFIPSIGSSGLIKTGKNVGIGTTNPQTKFHIANGDIFVESGRIGINTLPSYSLHINDEQKILPSLILSSNDNIGLIAYAYKNAVGIGTSSIPDDVNLYVNGKIKSTKLNINEQFEIKDNLISCKIPLEVNEFKSTSFINSCDIKIDNISIKESINYLSNISNVIDKDFNLINDLYINTNSKILTIDNISLSNLNLINKDDFFSDITTIKSKIEIYNDGLSKINNIYADTNNNIYISTNQHKIYKYAYNEVNSTIILDTSYDKIKTKFNKLTYYYNNNLYYYNNSWNLIVSDTIKDYSYDNNTYYYINNNNKLKYKGKNVNLITNDDIDILINTVFENVNTSLNIIKVECGDDYVVILDDNYNLYSFGKNNLGQLGRITNVIYDSINAINILENSRIIDISCGFSHTLVLYENGNVWSFGDNVNNSTFKKGYSTNTIIPTKINLTNIIKIKAYSDNSIFLDKDGKVYICGNININYITNNIYLIPNIPKIIDITCGTNNVVLLSYINDIYTFNNFDNTITPTLLKLPNDFYGNSIKSKGSVIIGTKFYNTNNIPTNSLIVDNFIGIGTSANYDNINNYSLVVSGNINIKDGNIYKNGIIFNGSGTTTSDWDKTDTRIYYNLGNVGIGTINPIKTLDVNGDISLTGDLFIKGKLFNNQNNIIDNSSKIGINTATTDSGLNIFDTTFKINKINSINILNDINTLTCNVFFNDGIYDYYDNPVAISGDSKTIATTLYKLDTLNPNNKNDVYIYKNIDNVWAEYIIQSPFKNNVYFGNNINISYDGTKIFISAYNDYEIINTITVYKGIIYEYTYDNNNYTNTSIKKYETSKIGYETAISKDGSIITSLIKDDYYNIFYNNSLINFNYNFHVSFENCKIDIDDNGNTIIASFNTNQYNIYNNVYIIKNNTKYFIKKYNGNINYTINNVSISSNGKRICLGVKDNRLNQDAYDVAYIYDLDDFYIESSNNLLFYNIEPIKVFKVPINFNYKTKMSKNGNFILSATNSLSYSYKYENITNTWITKEIDYLFADRVNFNISPDGLNYIIGFLKLELNNDKAYSYIKLYNLYENKIVFNFSNDGIFHYYNDVYFNNIICDNYQGYGSNIKDINIDNLIGNDLLQGGILIANDNKIIVNNNIRYEDRKFIIDGDIYCCNLDTPLDLTKIKQDTLLNLQYGGLGNCNIFKNEILFAEFDYINSSSNFKWDNINSNLTIIGSIISCNIGGNGYNITNLRGENIQGIISHNQGGLGINRIPSGNILFGDTFNSINTDNYLKWNNTEKTLNINGNIIGNSIFSDNFIGDGRNISNINIETFNKLITIDKGGVGVNYIPDGVILFGNTSNKIDYTSNLLWNSQTFIINNNVKINGIINGNGNELYNLDASKLVGKVKVENGGIGDFVIPQGRFIIGGLNQTINANDKLFIENRKLILDGDFHTCNIYSTYYGDGTNIENINANNIQSGMLKVNKGGTGINNVPNGRFLIGNTENELAIMPNMIWNETLNTLIFENNTKISINKITANILDVSGEYVYNSNINKVIGVNKGGTGLSQILDGQLLIGSNNELLNCTSNLLWSSTNNNFIVNGTIITNEIKGSARDLTNITASNINGILKVNNGGIGRQNIPDGQILVGSNNNPIYGNSNLLWNYNTNELTVKGDALLDKIYGDGLGIRNIQTANILGTLSITSGGTGQQNIEKGNILIGNNNDPIYTTPNIKYDIENNILNLNTLINNSTNKIRSKFLEGDGSGLSNIVASNIIGKLPVKNGGTGLEQIQVGEILYGGNNTINLKSTSDFTWDETAKYLNINGNILLRNNGIIEGIFKGDGIDITNLKTENINGILNITKGGTGNNILDNSTIIVSDGSKLTSTSNLLWINNKLGLNLVNNIPKYSLDIDGDINFTGEIYKNANKYISESGWSNMELLNCIKTNSNLLIGYNEIDTNYKVKVDGNLYVSGDITGLSDIKYKNNIIAIDNALEKVENLKGVYYNRTDLIETKRHIGLIAQDVEKIIPEVVINSEDTGKSIAYGNLIGLLVEAIKDLSNKIKVLENKECL